MVTGSVQAMYETYHEWDRDGVSRFYADVCRTATFDALPPFVALSAGEVKYVGVHLLLFNEQVCLDTGMKKEDYHARPVNNAEGYSD